MAEMKRAIITGATGAIGIALVNKLLSENMDVTVIVNPRSKRLSRLPRHPKLKVIQCPVEKLDALTIPENGAYDMFFHLAWVGTVGTDRDDMYLQNRNVKYTLDAVELARRCGCEVFIGSGSQAEYGRTDKKLRSDTPVNPETGYGIAKLCAGKMSQMMCRQLGIRHIWTRILSVYGPYDGDQSMVMDGIRKMLAGECPAFSAGEQMWDYLYSEDAANALYLAALYGKADAVYPVGSGEARPLREYITDMCSGVREATGLRAEAGIGQLPYRNNQVMYLCADIRELTEDTGFVPKITFENGIRKTIEWIRKYGKYTI